MFCKLFESELIGQICVIKKAKDETGEPEVRFFAQPEHLGVCEVTQVFADSDDGWDNCDAFFDSVDIAIAEKAIAPIIEMNDRFA